MSRAQVRRLPDSTWFLIDPVGEKDGKVAVKLSIESTWLCQFIWGHKTIQPWEVEAMKSVFQQWLKAHKQLASSQRTEATQGVAKNATRGRLAESTSSEDEEAGDSQQSAQRIDERCSKMWLDVPLVESDDTQKISIFPDKLNVWVLPDGATLGKVLAAMHHRRRLIREVCSPGVDLDDGPDLISKLACSFLLPVDDNRIVWSYAQSAFVVHFEQSAATGATRRSWRKVALAKPVDGDAARAEMESSLRMTLALARFKWNALDASSGRRYDGEEVSCATA